MSSTSIHSSGLSTSSVQSNKSGSASGKKKNWKSSSHAQELERIDLLLKDYEKANIELKDEIQRLNEIQAIHIKRLQDMDKQQKQLLKKIKSLETSLKFEKVAGDGLRKRGNTFEASVVEFQEKASNAEQQLDYFQSKNEELEETLQHERSTRLQLLHEKTKILNQYQDAAKTISKQESELVHCHQQITGYIQQIETLTEKVARQEDIMKYQSKEFVEISHEVIRLKEELLKTKEKLLSEYEEKHNFHFSVDLLQKEISYLRKELTAQAENHTQRSYAGFQPSHAIQYQSVTRHVNQYTASRYETSSFSADRAFTSKHERPSSDVKLLAISDSSGGRDQIQAKESFAESAVTPLNREIPNVFPPSTSASSRDLCGSRLLTSRVTEQSNGTVSRLSTADRPRGALDYLEVTNKGSTNFNNSERMEMLKWIRNSGKELAAKHQQQQKEKAEVSLKQSSSLQASLKSIAEQYGGQQKSLQKRRKEEENSGSTLYERDHSEESINIISSSLSRRELDRKSLWVGAGLNYRHDDETDRKLKDLQAGSTKQILRRILETID